MKIPFFQKLTLLDYPGKTAATVFTHGCNFRCPFCHNASLVARPAADEVAEDEFLSFLSKRTGLLDGVCVTGGEPLLQPDIAGFLQKIKNILEDVALSDFDCIEEILNVYKNLGYIINHRHDFG